MSSPYEEFRAQSASTSVQQGTAFWGDMPDAWDRVTLAGVELPGLCEVKGKVRNKVDKKSIPGTHGQTYTHIGYEPAEVQIKMRIWTADHLKKLADLIALVRPSKTPPKPVDIVHPSTTLLSIRSVLVLDVSLPERDDATDSYHVIMTCTEYTPSGNTKTKVTTANSSQGALNNQLIGAANTKIQQRNNPTSQNKAP